MHSSLVELTAEEQQAMLDFLRALVRTPSFSGDEGAVAALVMAEMRRLGFDDVWMDAAGNVVGRVGPQNGPALMLNSHMDTVKIADPDAWNVDPFGAEIREGRLYGLGACDMKSGLAATVYAAGLLKKRGVALQGPLLVACVVLEEPAEGTGTRTLFEEDGLHPDWVVIAEPSHLQIVRGQRGHVEMTLTVKGRSAHSSAPELGRNAIYGAARLIFNLEILAGQLADDPFLGPGVLAVTDIRSNAVSRNAIPDRCEMTLDRRLTIGETEAMAVLEIQRIITREGANAEVRVIEEEVTTHTGKVYRVRRASLPWALEERHPLVKAMAQAVRTVGLRPTMTRWHFATEGAYTAAVAQVPTVGFGPGNPALPHTVNEYVEIGQVYAAAQVYAALGMQLLAG
ncbi:MAG TPA: YgeY family selenium metabolism-linked hydrolase [Anaerolineae bacterium]|nr:YgeY family selenium metabolism-linked hydrolase [Anaerolineae bacterium]HQK14359.1 YgeY family selenium metabolism-linked hydrolase [Anaerolineae bacterium]